MSIPIVLSFAAAYISMIMAVAVLFRDRQSLYHRIFASGMFLLAVEEILRGLANNAAGTEDAIFWQEWVLFTSAIIPGTWFAFSIIYARAGASIAQSNWKWGLLALVAIPGAFVAVFRGSHFAGVARINDEAPWTLHFEWSGHLLQYFILLISILVL